MGRNSFGGSAFFVSRNLNRHLFQVVDLHSFCERFTRTQNRWSATQREAQIGGGKSPPNVRSDAFSFPSDRIDYFISMPDRPDRVNPGIPCVIHKMVGETGNVNVSSERDAYLIIYAICGFICGCPFEEHQRERVHVASRRQSTLPTNKSISR